MRNLKFKLIVFRILIPSTFAVILIFVVAIIYYPGGTIVDENHVVFDFKFKTQSDLGRTIAINSESNHISRVVFIFGLTLGAMIIGCFYLIVWNFFQDRIITKVLSVLGSLFGVTQAIVYFGIIATPSDVYSVVHNRVLYSVEAFLIAAITLYIAVYFLRKDFPRLNISAFLFLIISAFIYAMVILCAYLFQESIITVCFRMGHTMYIYATIIAYGLQPISGVIYLKRKDNLSFYKAEDILGT